MKDVNLRPDIIEALDGYAARNGLDLDFVVNHALEAYMAVCILVSRGQQVGAYDPQTKKFQRMFETASSLASC